MGGFSSEVCVDRVEPHPTLTNCSASGDPIAGGLDPTSQSEGQALSLDKCAFGCASGQARMIPDHFGRLRRNSDAAVRVNERKGEL